MIGWVTRSDQVVKMDMRCANCVFGQRSDDLGLPGGEELRCCRRRTERPENMWPAVVEGNWCGEWEGREGERRL